MPDFRFVCPWCDHKVALVEVEPGLFKCPQCRRGRPPGYLGGRWTAGELYMYSLGHPQLIVREENGKAA